MPPRSNALEQYSVSLRCIGGGCLQKAEAGGKGKIFRKAADVAVAHSQALDAGHVPIGLKLQFAFKYNFSYKLGG